MNSTQLTFAGETLTALTSGALFWQREKLLAVADLHLGKSDRIARRSGAMLPPYETTETLSRLADVVDTMQPNVVLCLGDTFDDMEAIQALREDHLATLTRLQAGRRWLWLEGNHDPGPVELGGEHLAELSLGSLTFRHIARDDALAGEVSGHYHPKARLKGISRPCFMVDDKRLILPAFGCYTGGLSWTEPVLRRLFASNALAYLTGPNILPVPVPEAA